MNRRSFLSSCAAAVVAAPVALLVTREPSLVFRNGSSVTFPAAKTFDEFRDHALDSMRYYMSARRQGKTAAVESAASQYGMSVVSTAEHRAHQQRMTEIQRKLLDAARPSILLSKFGV